MNIDIASDEQLECELAQLEAQLANHGFAPAPKVPPVFAVAALLALTEADFDLAAAVFETNEGMSGACTIPTRCGEYVIEATLASNYPDHEESEKRSTCALELSLVIGENRPMEGEPISHLKEAKVCEDEDVGGHLRLLFEEGFLLRKLRDQALRT